MQTSPTDAPDALREAAARMWCARSSGRFCDNVGASVGCKSGRGAPPDGKACKASMGQLQLSGHLDDADAALAIIVERCAVVAEAQAKANADARTDRADDEMAFEFRGLGKAIAAAIRAQAGEAGK